MVPLKSAIPKAVRAEICARFERTITDIQECKATFEAGPTAASRAQWAGSWVVTMRLFDSSLLREESRGGERGDRATKDAMAIWDEGLYRSTFTKQIRTRAGRRSKRTNPTIDQLHRRAVDKGAEGKIGQMAGVYDSSAVLPPATLASLTELKKLFPPRFVPLDLLAASGAAG